MSLDTSLYAKRIVDAWNSGDKTTARAMLDAALAATHADGIEALAKKYHHEMHPKNTTLEDCSYSTCGFFVREIDALTAEPETKGGK